jgi:hypothetical protein
MKINLDIVNYVTYEHTNFQYEINLLYYWFSVGEGTLPLHHLIFEITPAKTDMLQTTTAK